MKKGGGAVRHKPRGWILVDHPTRVGLLSKTHGRILIDWPRGFPVCLTRNVRKLALHRAVRNRDLFHRLLRRSVRLNPVVWLASKILDEKNLKVLLKRLARETDDSRIVKLPVIDLAILLLDDEEKLDLIANISRKRVEHFLSKYGIQRRLSLVNYRKHIERLRHIAGIRLKLDK
jgi:hypothetical protein